MPAPNDPARRSGAAKSKEEADCQQACGATRNRAGSPTGEVHGTEHGVIDTVLGSRRQSRRLETPALPDGLETVDFATGPTARFLPSKRPSHQP
jgi:hypothetical protein